MIPIISIVGRSNTGKTTLIEKLIPELSRRGYRVATIKHAPSGFEIDHEGKDSWRHKRAGAFKTVLVSSTELVVMEAFEREYNVEELIDLYIKNADVVLMEGHKKNPYPKIEVLRKDIEPVTLDVKDSLLIAFVGDKHMDTDIPHFRTDEVQRLTDLIEKRYLRR